jgi:hypothetical protein
MIGSIVLGLAALSARLRAAFQRSHLHLTRHIGRCGMAAID